MTVLISHSTGITPTMILFVRSVILSISDFPHNFTISHTDSADHDYQGVSLATSVSNKIFLSHANSVVKKFPILICNYNPLT